MGRESMNALAAVASGLGAGLKTFAGNSGRAAAAANAVSKEAQTAAANFNQGSADKANAINQDTILAQYGFNSGQSELANNFTAGMWDKAAAWNEEMFNRQMEFNAAEAQKQRDWQERMSNTQYQRAIKDLEKAGLNPILAATGGMTAGVGSGSAASASAPSMSGASGAMASGGLLGANDASISGYNGQMEYMGGMLGLMSSALAGISSAVQAFALMNTDNTGENYTFADFIGDIFSGDNKSLEKQYNDPNTKWNEGKRKYEQNKDKVLYGIDKFFNPKKYPKYDPIE